MTLIAPPDPAWAAMAQAEGARWTEAAIHGLVAVHHIGSTSVPGLPAKPIIDLLPVFETAAAMAAAKPTVTSFGYEWMDEYGLPGRAYARLDDPDTGRRAIHAHCYPMGHSDIDRHLAFRDALRGNGALRAAYTAEKARCAGLHPHGGPEYGACKSAWIDRAEAAALAHRGDRA